MIASIIKSTPRISFRLYTPAGALLTLLGGRDDVAMGRSGTLLALVGLMD